MKPGRILILLAGRHRGKRVLFLRNLTTSILVSGPYKLNSVPTRQINRSYLLATAFKLDLSGIDMARVVGTISHVGKGPCVQQHALCALAELESSIITKIQKFPNLKRYLSTPFTLQSDTKAHILKF